MERLNDKLFTLNKQFHLSALVYVPQPLVFMNMGHFTTQTRKIVSDGHIYYQPSKQK